MAPNSVERTYFGSLDDGLRAWRAVTSTERQQIQTIVDRIAEQLGAPHSVFIGQKNPAVCMSFGPTKEVGIYVQGRRIDIAPAIVRAMGGHSRLARLVPGLTRPPGQRSEYARYRLAG